MRKRKEKKEGAKIKKSETKLSGASCFAICHCHGCNLRYYVETSFLRSAGDNPMIVFTFKPQIVLLVFHYKVSSRGVLMELVS